MKTSKIILIVIFCNVLATYANTEQCPDTIDIKNLVDIRIAQSEKEESVVKLFIHNQQSDSIFLRSMFNIDEPARLSHILIYSCKYQAEVDSVTCNWGFLPYEMDDPLIEYAKGKVFIPAKGTASFEIPIWRDYIESEVYLKVQLLFVYKGKSYVYNNTTNQIYIDRLNKK